MLGLAKKISLYFHTIRYLKLRQIYWRLFYKLFRRSPPKKIRQCLAVPLARFADPIFKLPVLVGPEKFNIHNVAASLSEINWSGDEMPLLWRYHQHYFDDLTSDNWDRRKQWHVALLTSWLEKVTDSRDIGWDPYPTSMRIVNWCKYIMFGEELSSGARDSLCTQAEHLSRRLEHHLLGNHLFANAKALYFAGSIFDGQHAERWLSISRKIIDGELAEQILPDGGHFERSPMYHSSFLEDVLDLINIARCYGRDDDAGRWRQFVGPMLTYLKSMSHRNGAISFFNDSCLEQAPSLIDLIEYGARLDILPLRNRCAESDSELRCVVLKHSGYARIDSADASAILDIGEVGPDYLPGHAHADTLSFELSIFGELVFVNSGTSVYGDSEERERQRGTAAHNTICVSNLNSSEVWSGFRVARRARPYDFVMEYSDNLITISCSHDGYEKLLKPPVTHNRTWQWRRDAVTIIDHLKSPGSYGALGTARFHLHPSITIKDLRHNTVVCALRSGHEIRVQTSQQMQIIPSTYHPRFGVSVENRCILFSMSAASQAETVVSWAQKT